MNDLRTAVSEAWSRALDDERTVAIPDVADRIMEDYPDVVSQESERLVRSSIVRMLKDNANRETEESSQLSLFGFPSVIAVPVTDDGYVYMQSMKATWADLSSGAQIRETNVRRAQARLDQYNGALEHVRPIMEGTDVTLAEAVEQLGDGDSED